MLGSLLGWGTARGGASVQRVWPVVLRVQILITSATLSLVASWRLTSASELLGPPALAAGFWLLLGATVATRGRRSPGQSALEAWAVSPDSGFWVVPAATAFRRVHRHDDRPSRPTSSLRLGAPYAST